MTESEQITKLKSENEKLRDALEFYADIETWHPDLMLCMSDKGRDDLEETPRSRFTPGLRARKALQASDQKGVVE